MTLQRPQIQASLLQSSPARAQTVPHKQLLRHTRWPRSHLLLITPCRPARSSAVQAHAAHKDAVRDEFAKAGIPDADAIRTLRGYKTYYNWNIEARLRPALQLWTQAIGSKQLSERLSKLPSLLVHTPAECGLVYTWLASFGVHADKVQQKAPRIMARQLSDVQATVAAIQTALQLPDTELPEFFNMHFYSLQFTPQHASKVLQVISDLVASPTASDEVRDLVTRCDQQLFVSPDQVHERISYFCQKFKGGKRAASIALRNRVYRVTEKTMQKRAAHLQEKFGWTTEELNRKINAFPSILAFKPSTLATNIKALQSSGFPPAQALNLCASYPALMTRDWTSACNIQKLQFLSTVLQMSLEDIGARGNLLSYSVEARLGPRFSFLYSLAGINPDTPILQSGLASWLQAGSDAKLAAYFDRPSHNSDLVYSQAWKQHWLQRWRFLRCDMDLSIADIAACRALLFISLHDTLAPRWQFLKLAEAEQADFKAVEHLQALATLTDEQFSGIYSRPGLLYNDDFKQQSQAE